MRGRRGEARRGNPRQGKARHGKARQGKGRRGKTKQDTPRTAHVHDVNTDVDGVQATRERGGEKVFFR